MLSFLSFEGKDVPAGEAFEYPAGDAQGVPKGDSVGGAAKVAKYEKSAHAKVEKGLRA